MAILEKIISFFDGWNEEANKLKQKTEKLLEEATIKSQAEFKIKTGDFVSEKEKSIMLEAARKEQQRMDELSLRLGRDSQLKDSYEEAFARISSNVDTSTPRGLRIAQEVALETATEELKRHRLLQEKFKEPAFKEAYEEAREQASRAIEEANHERTKL